MLPSLPHGPLASPDQLSARDVSALLASAAALKRAGQRTAWQPLRGRHLALMGARPGDDAEAFGAAVTPLGGSVSLLHAGAWLSSACDQLPEAARVLGRLYDAVDCCDLPAALLAQIGHHAGVPVFDGLARPGHPLRLLTELLTLGEVSGRPLAHLRLCIEGDAQARPAAVQLARTAGIEVLPRVALLAGRPDAETHDGCDFVLDLSAPPAATGRLLQPHAPALQQSRIASLLAGNQRCVLQALVVAALS
jgi:ornithine carbamoyltransferase